MDTNQPYMPRQAALVAYDAGHPADLSDSNPYKHLVESHHRGHHAMHRQFSCPVCQRPSLEAVFDLNPSDDSAYPYTWRVLQDGEEVAGGGSDVASEDSVEWARQADEYLTGHGFLRTGKYVVSGDDTATAPVQRSSR